MEKRDTEKIRGGGGSDLVRRSREKGGESRKRI